tara:strand:- start:22493 stop:22786 length:294 start_codon:yes stop_codon:yes gene_type:complete
MGNRVQIVLASVNQGCVLRRWGALELMLPLTKEEEAKYGLELATKRQEHSDLNAAIDTLTQSHVADRMLIQRLKKRKLALKDRIVELENILLPDIIA